MVLELKGLVQPLRFIFKHITDSHNQKVLESYDIFMSTIHTEPDADNHEIKFTKKEEYRLMCKNIGRTNERNEIKAEFRAKYPNFKAVTNSELFVDD